MPPGLTFNSLFCALLYLAVVLAALPIAGGWRGRGRRGRGKWLWVALIFAALVAWRIGLGELRLQEHVRAFTRSDGIYEERKPAQTLLTLSAVALVMLVAWNVAFKDLQGRANWALAATVSLVIYSLVRLVSLHAIDTLIYNTGPFHLNYVIDLGLTGIVLGLAGLELWKPEAPPRRR